MFESPTLLNKNKIDFVPMINEDALNATGDQADSISPQLRRKDMDGGMADINNISAINNTTMQDTSQNIS